MTDNNVADVKIERLREKLRRMEKNLADKRRRNETKVKCYLATGFLQKLGLDDLTKMLDDSRNCDAFCDFVTKVFLDKINTNNKNWKEAAESYIDSYTKQDKGDSK